MGETVNLRRVNKKDPGTAGDVENLLQEETASPNDDPTLMPCGDAAPGPASLAEAVFRGVVDHVATPVEDVASKPGGLLALAKLAFLGVFLGMATSIAVLAVAVFLESLDVVHLESAHGLREAAFGRLHDPEILADVQEAAGLKFLSMSEYDVLRREVDEAPGVIATAEERLQKAQVEMDEKMKDVDVASLQAEHESLLKHPLLGLDKYCGDCLWDRGITCDTRVAYMHIKHKLKLIKATVAAMDHPSCIKN